MNTRVENIVNERLAAVLDWMGRLATDSEAFVRGELPELVKEVVRWERVSAGGWAAVSVAVLTVCLYVGAKAMRDARRDGSLQADEKKRLGHENDWNGYDDHKGTRLAVALVVAVPTFIVAACNTHAAVKAWTAPRLVVLEWVRAMGR